MIPTACLLLKAPREGLVKTRLARHIGFPRATALYRKLVERQIRALPADWKIVIHFAPSDAVSEMTRWLGAFVPEATSFTPQPVGDLGARLEAAVATEFSRGTEALFLLGGDCPELHTAHLLEAHRQLDQADLVLGPAADGGYVLLGLKKPHPELFTGIAWSTQTVLSQTLEAAGKAGLSTRHLPLLEDIDDLESLRRHPDLRAEFGL